MEEVLYSTLWDLIEVDPVIQLLVPEGEQKSIWQLYHEHTGNWGPEKTISLIQKRFFLAQAKQRHNKLACSMS